MVPGNGASFVEGTLGGYHKFITQFSYRSFHLINLDIFVGAISFKQNNTTIYQKFGYLNPLPKQPHLTNCSFFILNEIKENK